MLRFYSAPRMVNFEAFIAVACTAVHATFCGFLRWWLTKVTHNGCGCPGCLPISFNNSFQSEISKQTIDSPLSKIHIMLTARTRKSGCPRGQWIALPACVINKFLFSYMGRKMNRMKMVCKTNCDLCPKALWVVPFLSREEGECWNKPGDLLEGNKEGKAR